MIANMKTTRQADSAGRLQKRLKSIFNPLRADTQPSVTSILECYLKSAPDPQSTLDLFKGEWSSALPEPMSKFKAGAVGLFDDDRVKWFLKESGGVSGKTVLELGPLEGGHTYMLEKAGAAQITAIEANSRAYLKCLVLKELLGLQRGRFLYGDFTEYLRQDGPKFDICLAAGVLYHVQNPAELLALLARRCTGHLLLWTHYYDQALIAPDSELASRFTAADKDEYAGFKYTLHRQEYRTDLKWVGFCGGTRATSQWLSREDILNGLSHFGFHDFRIGFDEPRHINGPAFAVVAAH
jgi:2-polyprenyl-3-methyl-5-hydroxy-6-metoxy-1,4-benzoquinol methylase